MPALHRLPASRIAHRSHLVFVLSCLLTIASVRPASAQGVLSNENTPDLSPLSLFMNADVVVKAVMILLACASVITWTILLAKGLEILSVRRAAFQAFDRLAQAHNLTDAGNTLGERKDTAGQLVRAALAECTRSQDLPSEGIKERLPLEFARIEAHAGRTLARGTGLLATIGSTAPFIGLFGTVWGIMNSFVGIGQSQTTNLAVVAPGIAEALLSTAVGLAAAIPAVVIYNIFARAVTAYRAILNDGSSILLQHVSRDLDRRTADMHRQQTGR